jgi:hypothetical protein
MVSTQSPGFRLIPTTESNGRHTARQQALPRFPTAVDSLGLRMHNNKNLPDTPSPFSPLKIGPLTLKNRFIKSATNEGMAKGGTPSRQLVRFHEAMAAGGTALTTVAYCAVSRDGRTFTDQITLDRDAVPHLRVLTDAVHRHGGAACAQITHGGCFTFLEELSTRRPLSASGGFNKVGIMSGRFLKQAMSEADMHRIADEFAQSALLAREAGFDAVEIHMGHGYLLSQFISPLYNQRRDDWGGNLERRLRFPSLVLRRVLDAVGRDLAVICKYSVTEGAKGAHPRRRRRPPAGTERGDERRVHHHPVRLVLPQGEPRQRQQPHRPCGDDHPEFHRAEGGVPRAVPARTCTQGTRRRAHAAGLSGRREDRRQRAPGAR